VCNNISWKALFQTKKKEEFAKLERKRQGKVEQERTPQISLVLKKEAINGNEL